MAGSATEFNPDDFANTLDSPVPIDPFDDPKAVTGLLSDDEKRRAIECWNSGAVSLKKIIQYACGDGLDGRSFKGVAIKKYLADQNLKANPAHVHIKKMDSFVLTEANQEFIANNAGSMKPLEITKLLFNDSSLTPLSSQFRVVKIYYDGLDTSVKAQTDDENTTEYNPPRNQTQALARVNRYVLEAIDPEKITPRNKECLQRLIRFMHTHRFIFEMRNLPLNSERALFESSFVRFTNDKPDLTEEEIDLYLNQCSDIVAYQRMQRELVVLTKACSDTMEADQKVPMALVEAVGKLRGDIHASSQRQKTTLNDLNGKRAGRLDKVNASNESVLKLIEAFRDETQRGHILRVIENRQNEVRAEVKRLETVDELHAHLFGVAEREVS